MTIIFSFSYMLLKFCQILFLFLIINPCLVIHLPLSLLIIFTCMCHHFLFVRNRWMRISFKVGLLVTKCLMFIYLKLSFVSFHFEIYFNYVCNFWWIVIWPELTENILSSSFVIIENSLFSKISLLQTLSVLFSLLYLKFFWFIVIGLDMSVRSYLEYKGSNPS